MKKITLFVAAAVLMCSCGIMKNNASSTGTKQSANASATTAPTATTSTTTADPALTAGQGAGTAILNLYNQYKADGKYDYKNMQNILNTVTLLANCEGLKSNYKNTEYLKQFGKGIMASSLGLVTQDNVETVTGSLVDMVKSSETVQNAKTQAQSTANTAAGYANTAAEYANTAAQYAGSISSLLSLFGK
ncbi:MAG: hypothetical protein IJQ97_05705 [Paludibacteraceae bacterium]|nr:hypothetical protein [Paludibacteraceae bacterium]